MFTPKKQAALEALLTHGTKKSAAEAAGISVRALTNYLKEPDFQREYTRGCRLLITDAARQSQKYLSNALAVLCSIVQNKEETAGNRIAAARSLLEYGLKLTEFSDIIAVIEDNEDVL